MSELSLPAPVRELVEAINGGDTEAFVAAFTADGFVSDWGTVRSGPDGVREWARTDAIGAGAHMTVLTAVSVGDTTRVRFAWKSRKFTGESTGIFVVEGERLKSFTIPPEH